ncbi:hypothetical protein [Clostridium grantii]|uniref:DUF5659 domain-containing protein n=1 Tax=Clostridium grantii DSM 8605 TaxID=1121316 RepID=A0A1M5SDH4_9CLOT|nr:hypothetical protein [Clostridium grantii]SHH36647.1 hypothetical protein SAMN02745207_00884 [Clostridium grantii DSM 8605]
MENNYSVIKKKSLAEALNFIGFRYFKYQDEEGKTVYSFENTDKFNFVLHELIKLKKSTSNY